MGKKSHIKTKKGKGAYLRIGFKKSVEGEVLVEAKVRELFSQRKEGEPEEKQLGAGNQSDSFLGEIGKKKTTLSATKKKEKEGVRPKNKVGNLDQEGLGHDQKGRGGGGV